MDAGDLRVFAAVARLGGMNRAAAALHTVQSNVTARIRALEDELGVALFVRHSRGVALTAAGQRLLPYAARVEQVLEEARRVVADDGTPRGPLTIGTLESTMALRLAPILAGYAAAYPEVDLNLRTGTTAEMVEAVLARQADGAFVCGPVDHRDLDEETVFEEELVLIAGRKLRALDAALRRPALKIVVLRLGCSYRQRLEEILARRGVVGLRRLEFGTLEAILAAVAAGLGVTLFPRGLVAAAAREGRVAVHALPRAEARVRTSFIRRHDTPISGALTAFLRRARAGNGSAQAAA